MAQEMIRQHAGHHGFADRHRANPHTRVVAAFGHDVGVVAAAIDGLAWRQDRRCRFYGEAGHHRLAGGNAAEDAAGVVGEKPRAVGAGNGTFPACRCLERCPLFETTLTSV
jgi:hypothetical protein